MIRKAGQRLIQSLRTKERVADRVQSAQRYKKRPGDLPSRTFVGSATLGLDPEPVLGVTSQKQKEETVIGGTAISPVNTALLAGDGYSAMG